MSFRDLLPILLVTGLLPLWNRLRASAGAQSLPAWANTTVIGVLLAALYQPVWTSAIDSPKSLALALILFAGLQIWKLAPSICRGDRTTGGARAGLFRIGGSDSL